MKLRSVPDGCNSQCCAPADRINSKVPASAGAFVLRPLVAVVGLLFVVIALLFAVAASAQTPQGSTTDSVPQTTIVPVQQPTTQIVERTAVYEDPTREMDRAERRAYKARVYAAKIDSLVQSRNYVFFPNTMQELPGGLIRNIYAEFLYFGVFIDHVEMHLPTERGITQYVEMLNFDSMSVRAYQASKMQWGWSISFNIADGDDLYHADLAVSATTGETVLTLITPHLTMRYVGWLWDKFPDTPHTRRWR